VDLGFPRVLFQHDIIIGLPPFLLGRGVGGSVLSVIYGIYIIKECR
jgi:hypothetical protein